MVGGWDRKAGVRLVLQQAGSSDLWGASMSSLRRLARCSQSDEKPIPCVSSGQPLDDSPCSGKSIDDGLILLRLQRTGGVDELAARIQMPQRIPQKGDLLVMEFEQVGRLQTPLDLRVSS